MVIWIIIKINTWIILCSKIQEKLLVIMVKHYYWNKLFLGDNYWKYNQI